MNKYCVCASNKCHVDLIRENLAKGDDIYVSNAGDKRIQRSTFFFHFIKSSCVIAYVFNLYIICTHFYICDNVHSERSKKKQYSYL